MSFSGDLLRFRLKTEKRANAVFVNVAALTKASITDGSPVTASPGQPVDTGFLKNSWQLTFPAPNVAEIVTNCEYARAIEDNTRGATLRSKVGGFHSVKYTVAGFSRLVEAANASVPQ
jgi:hypothetical protein